MYYPILRGKQFELIALRELSEHISPALMRPVIEPVRKNLSPLKKTLETLQAAEIKPILIINPSIGDFSNKSNNIEHIDAFLDMEELFTPCLKISRAEDFSNYNIDLNNTALFVENAVDRAMIPLLNSANCVLVNKERVHPGALSQLNNFILYSDSFDKKTRNADYGEKSYFSSLHSEWRGFSNAIGFGDYTILSEEYIESGGPAYVVTIHLSYIDQDAFDTMFVRHFSSFNDDSPANPGGKFKSALSKLCEYDESHKHTFYPSTGLTELRALQGRPFPGLGQVKKLCMKHHIETTCNYLRG